MNLVFKKGQAADLEKIVELYAATHHYLAETTNYPGWRKDIYPIKQTAIGGIAEQNLYLLQHKGKIIASAIIRHQPEAAYSEVEWGIEADQEEVAVIYTLVVHPNYLHQGMARRLIYCIQEHCQEFGDKAIRLDVYEKNIPAMRLYEKCGFKYIATVDLGLREYGLENFKLYEKIL